MINPKRKPEVEINKVFLDFGARTGESLDWFVNKRPDLAGSKIVFFEPNPEHRKSLKKIKRANRDRDISIVQRAVWIENGKFRFTNYPMYDIASHLSVVQEPIDVNFESFEVEAVDINDVLKKHESDYVIVKLDVEGAEIEVVSRLLCTGSVDSINELYVEWHQYPSAKMHRRCEKLISKLRKRVPFYARWEY